MRSRADTSARAGADALHLYEVVWLVKRVDKHVRRLRNLVARCGWPPGTLWCCARLCVCTRTLGRPGFCHDCLPQLPSVEICEAEGASALRQTQQRGLATCLQNISVERALPEQATRGGCNGRTAHRPHCCGIAALQRDTGGATVRGALSCGRWAAGQRRRPASSRLLGHRVGSAVFHQLDPVSAVAIEIPMPPKLLAQLEYDAETNTVIVDDRAKLNICCTRQTDETPPHCTTHLDERAPSTLPTAFAALRMMACTQVPVVTPAHWRPTRPSSAGTSCAPSGRGAGRCATPSAW